MMRDEQKAIFYNKPDLSSQESEEVLGGGGARL